MTARSDAALDAPLAERPDGSAHRPAIAALVAAGMLWGSSFVFGKIALRDIGPNDLTVLRFVVATAALSVVGLRRGRPSRADLPWFLLAGLLTVPATFLLQFIGLQRTTASTAALIIGTLPALVAVAARIVLRERLGRRKIAAVVVSTTGIALTVGTPGAGNSWLGDALVLASMFAVVGWVLLGKRLTAAYPPLVLSAWTLTLGTALLIVITLPWTGPPALDLSAATWGSVVVLGVGCSACTTVLWNWGLSRVPAGPAGVFLNVEPLAGALLGVLVLGDTVTAGLVVGGVLILAAAVVVTRRR